MANVEAWGPNAVQVTLDGSGDHTMTRNIVPTKVTISNLAAAEYVMVKLGDVEKVLTSLSGEEVSEMFYFTPPWPPPFKPVLKNNGSGSSFAGTLDVVFMFV